MHSSSAPKTASLDRTFSLPVGASYRPAMRVSADAGRDLDALMQRGRVATIDVSSQQSASALGGALAAVDGSLRTGWTAAADDESHDLASMVDTRASRFDPPGHAVDHGRLTPAPCDWCSTTVSRLRRQ